MTNRFGYRGYIGSRPYFGDRVPQHVQNLVVRDYCQRNGIAYLLSATEYAMPSCYIMLHELLREVERVDGFVLYSVFMLPMKRERRDTFCRAIFQAGASIHGAVENLEINDEQGLSELGHMYELKIGEQAQADSRQPIEQNKLSNLSVSAPTVQGPLPWDD